MNLQNVTQSHQPPPILNYLHHSKWNIFTNQHHPILCTWQGMFIRGTRLWVSMRWFIIRVLFASKNNIELKPNQSFCHGNLKNQCANNEMPSYITHTDYINYRISIWNVHNNDFMLHNVVALNTTNTNICRSQSL